MSNAPEMQFGRGARPMAPVVGRSGRLSLMIWLVAFVLAVVSFLLFSLTPAGAPEATRTVTTYFFIVVFLVLAPIAHVVGFVLGLVAIFKAGPADGGGRLRVYPEWAFRSRHPSADLGSGRHDGLVHLTISHPARSRLDAKFAATY